MTNKKLLYELLYELLKNNEEARRTRNIGKVFEYMFRKLGAITETGQWNYEAYINNVNLQTIDRTLRTVKEENGWQDKESKEREEAHREANRPQYGGATEPIKVIDQSVEDIEADELMAAVKAKHPGISGKDLMLAVAEEQRIKIRGYGN